MKLSDYSPCIQLAYICLLQDKQLKSHYPHIFRFVPFTKSVIYAYNIVRDVPENIKQLYSFSEVSGMLKII